MVPPHDLKRYRASVLVASQVLIKIKYSLLTYTAPSIHEVGITQFMDGICEEE